MKFKVKAAGLSTGKNNNYKRGDGFPANVKGFDYEKALSRGLIEENKDGVVPKRKSEETVSPRISGPSADGDTDSGNGDRG
jgi:hypothetical protein